MRAHKRDLLVVLLSATLLTALTACSAPDTAPSGAQTESGASPTATTSATPGTEGKVDSLPIFDGVTDAAPEGWVAGACDALSFSTPSDWFAMPVDKPYLEFTKGLDFALSVTDETSTRSIQQTIRVSCNEANSDWDGSWEESEGAEWSRLDVEGAEYAAVTVQPHADATATGGTVPGELFKSMIQIVTAEGVYYTVHFTLPANDSSYDVVGQVASSLDVGWSGTTRTEP